MSANDKCWAISVMTISKLSAWMSLRLCWNCSVRPLVIDVRLVRYGRKTAEQHAQEHFSLLRAAAGNCVRSGSNRAEARDSEGMAGICCSSNRQDAGTPSAGGPLSKSRRRSTLDLERQERLNSCFRGWFAGPDQGTLGTHSRLVWCR